MKYIFILFILIACRTTRTKVACGCQRFICIPPSMQVDDDATMVKPVQMPAYKVVDGKLVMDKQ